MADHKLIITCNLISLVICGNVQHKSAKSETSKTCNSRFFTRILYLKQSPFPTSQKVDKTLISIYNIYTIIYNNIFIKNKFSTSEVAL